MNQDQRDERDKETYDNVKELRTMLLGVEGQGGILKTLMEAARSHYNLKRVVWTLIGLLGGSGILVGGWQLLLQIT